jgi:beta-lactamase class C
MARAVQGYGENGMAIGPTGDQQTYYDFPGAGQMFSSARDLITFAAANLGELPIASALQDAMRLAQRGVFRLDAHTMQAMAWEVNDYGDVAVVDKPGGLNNSATYLGLVPDRRLGVMILINRGDQYPHEIGRKFLVDLARAQAN